MTRFPSVADLQQRLSAIATMSPSAIPHALGVLVGEGVERAALQNAFFASPADRFTARPPFLNAVARLCGDHTPHAINRALEFYASPKYGDVNVPATENRDHVIRLMRYAEEVAPMVGLTHQELIYLKLAMVFSDFGKRMSFVNGSFQKCFAAFEKISSPAMALDQTALLARSHPHLDGIADWLREYQLQTGAPLKLISKYPGQDVWGHESFAISGAQGQPFTPADRFQALRFLKIVFGGNTPGFPEGLYFHEIPGYVLAHAQKMPRAVLTAIFAHNGLEEAFTADGVNLTSTDYPFWGASFFKMIEGSYPPPIAGDILAILHCLLDRFDQGTLLVDGGRLVGGPIKIAHQRIAQNGWSAQQALAYGLEEVPRESEYQIHALWHRRIKGTPLEARLAGVYQQRTGYLQGVQQLIHHIDFTESQSPTAPTIIFANGRRVQKQPDESDAQWMERCFQNLIDFLPPPV